MKFNHPEHSRHLELSLDDVFLLPRYHSGGSRLDVDLRPADFPGSSLPIVTANMNAVTGKRMAESVARYGGLGVLPQDMDLDTVARIVSHIKSAPLRYDTPLVVHSTTTLHAIEGIIRKRAHGMVVVATAAGKPLGLITYADLRNTDRYTPAHAVMARHLMVLPESASYKEAFAFMEHNRLKAVPVVDSSGLLKGVLTRDDAVRLSILQPSTDSQGKLQVAVAVGISADARERVAQLVEAGVDAIVLDTAHGHQRRMLEAIAEAREVLDDHTPLIAGNVCTAEGVRALCEAGADVIKVNVGPGAMCTTRMKTGVGRPTFTAAMVCAAEARRHGRHIWADGGVRHPRDVALYLAAGAARVMIGTMLAGTYESPGDIHTDEEGNLYKVNYGMASARAVQERSSELDGFTQARKALFREGISSSRIYLRPGQESVGAILMDVLTGVRSALTYVGADSCESFHDKAIVGVQTRSGYSEGTPHGKLRR